jgi:phage I-like protein
VLSAFQNHGTDLVIDYEHQSLGGRYASPDGLAPAAGWVTGVEVRAGEGLWGTVRWTPAAARRILRREYRFLSPVVIIRKGDRKVVALDSVALTNRPAIAGMRPVINSRGDVVLEGDDAMADEVQVDVETKEDVMQQELTRLRQLLSVDEQTGDDEVVRQACSRLAGLLEDSRQREAEQRVVCAMQAGKVCEAQKGWATRYALRDPEGFDEWLDEAPVVVPLQRVLPEGEGAAEPDRPQRRSVIAAARTEWRANVLLQQLTNERAYVDEALQQSGEQMLGEQELL